MFNLHPEKKTQQNKLPTWLPTNEKKTMGLQVFLNSFNWSERNILKHVSNLMEDEPYQQHSHSGMCWYRSPGVFHFDFFVLIHHTYWSAGKWWQYPHNIIFPSCISKRILAQMMAPVKASHFLITLENITGQEVRRCRLMKTLCICMCRWSPKTHRRNNIRSSSPDSASLCSSSDSSPCLFCYDALFWESMEM